MRIQVWFHSIPLCLSYTCIHARQNKVNSKKCSIKNVEPLAYWAFRFFEKEDGSKNSLYNYVPDIHAGEYEKSWYLERKRGY